MFGFRSTMNPQQKGPEKPRRKPVQSRSWQTSLAIQEAFVRLLAGQDYGQVTIRAIVDLAGVGLGTFYEYFGSKEELARVCLHLRAKRIVQSMDECLAQRRGEPIAVIVDALIAVNVGHHRETPERWGPVYLLERHYSGRAAYRTMYGRFVALWSRALQSAADAPPAPVIEEASVTLQAIVYGLISHACIDEGEEIDFPRLMRRLRGAAHGYLGTLGEPPGVLNEAGKTRQNRLK